MTETTKDRWYTLSTEFKALFWSVVGLLTLIVGLGHIAYGLVNWANTALSTQHLIAGLIFFYWSQHPALKKRSREDDSR